MDILSKYFTKATIYLCVKELSWIPNLHHIKYVKMELKVGANIINVLKENMRIFTPLY